MIGFIDAHREAYGVEPICKVLPIAPSTYHERVAQRQDPARLSAQGRQDLALKPEIARVLPRTSRFTVCARCGARCYEKAFPSRAARWND
jgi:hypothetical protein